jgi:hypothetical protein
MSITVPCNGSGRPSETLATVRVANTETGTPFLPRKPNFLSGVISSSSKPLEKCFTIRLVEMEIPGTVCEQFIAGIEPKDPRTWLIAIHDATVSICQDDAGNVPVE